MRGDQIVVVLSLAAVAVMAILILLTPWLLGR
jgi:hypothetical protein